MFSYSRVLCGLFVTIDCCCVCRNGKLVFWVIGSAWLEYNFIRIPNLVSVNMTIMYVYGQITIKINQNVFKTVTFFFSSCNDHAYLWVVSTKRWTIISKSRMYRYVFYDIQNCKICKLTINILRCISKYQSIISKYKCVAFFFLLRIL